ncbi:hypothetical protein [Erwinia pyrifoliae]|uniref:hypothetical protein n=1 Tax=Erwinia pyrifoliae TaxID=79967 RepID=UPI00220C34A8|nr:hypothetical protein [Erwinia pyrifoliae]MCT2385798.1 hypothetical protein [Erwinia pyrifoliae]MCU8588626.1 hypothetical protein [Erwinia pyrifoliae]UWS29636.1 hypothetical protein NYP81_17555 [Erwinia pyrifoliae]
MGKNPSANKRSITSAKIAVQEETQLNEYALKKVVAKPSEVRKAKNNFEVDDNGLSAVVRGLKLNDKTFDTALLKGNPVGLDIDLNYPLPAQEEVFKSVIQEKLLQIEAGEKLKKIDVWYNPRTGRIHILDGQHRFLAAAEKSMPIELNWKKLGFPPFQRTWKDTYYSNVTPAKEVLKNQKLRA